MSRICSGSGSARSRLLTFRREAKDKSKVSLCICCSWSFSPGDQSWGLILHLAHQGLAPVFRSAYAHRAPASRASWDLLRIWPWEVDLFRHANSCSCFCAARLCVGVGANCSTQHVLNRPGAGTFPFLTPPVSSLPLRCQMCLLIINTESKTATSQGMVKDPGIGVVRLYFLLCFWPVKTNFYKF